MDMFMLEISKGYKRKFTRQARNRMQRGHSYNWHDKVLYLCGISVVLVLVWGGHDANLLTL